jgi:hypothetical protein
MKKQDYYQNKISEINKLIKVDLDQAYHLLLIELNMPYIPKKYEREFGELELKIKNSAKQKEVNYQMSPYDIFEIIQDVKSIKIGIALEQLKNLNLQSFILEIKSFFKTNQSSAIKAIVYEYLVSQKIDHPFIINEIKINPINKGSIVQSDEYQKAYLYIQNKIINNPSLAEVAIKVLEVYALNLFPAFVDQGNLGKLIEYLSRKMLGLKNIELLERELKNANKVFSIYKNNL